MGRNATIAVHIAIAAAAANGGGVVYFPAGQYFVQGPIVVAPGTVLRGESVRQNTFCAILSKQIIEFAKTGSGQR